MRDSQTKAIELEERLIDFAVRVIRLTVHLPQTPAGKHVAGQILRPGTSPAPNYGEARGAESHADFVHKIGIVLKELNETSIWLRVIDRSELLKKELLTGIMEENRELCREENRELCREENRELCRIFTASVTTARANRR